MALRDNGVTVRDVADHAGVALSTVSNAINHPERLAPKTLAKVQASIRDLGFVRNAAARQLRLGQSRVFGLVVIDAASPFFTVLERAAEDAAERHNYTVLLGNSGQAPERERRYIDLFESQRVQGLLITPLGEDLEPLRELRDRGTPVVLIDYSGPEDSFPVVSVDHVSGGSVAARHLLGLGCRRIAFVDGPVVFTQVADRYRGAAEELGPVGAESIRLSATALTVEGGVEAAHQILTMPKETRPDAVFAPNDLVALGIIETLSAAGLRVPAEVAVIGYDDVAFASSTRVPISTLRQPADEIGESAVELMMELLEDPQSRRKIAFLPELVVRQSTAGA